MTPLSMPLILPLIVNLPVSGICALAKKQQKRVKTIDIATFLQ
jgi:hypothetical protein